MTRGTNNSAARAATASQFIDVAVRTSNRHGCGLPECRLFPGVQPDLEGEKYIIGRFLKPEARKDIIDYFGSQEIVPTAMIDVSDGLSSEILHICRQSKTGCVLYEEKMPIAEETRLAAFKFNLDPTACALSGGEDYELLFTVKQDDYDKIAANTDISVIGYITDEEAGANIFTKGGNKHPITAQGWNAFK